MQEELFTRVREYLRENMGIYILITIIFAAGVMGGALSVRFMDTEITNELSRNFSVYTDHFQGSETVEHGSIFKNSILLNFRQILFIGIAGVFMFGFPFIALMIGLRGFMIGFTVGFLIENSAFGGLVFSLATIVPHNLIIIPAFLIIAVTAFSLSFFRFRANYLEKRSSSLSEHLTSYIKMITALCFAVIIGSIVETYVSTLFMRLSVPVLF